MLNPLLALLSHYYFLLASVLAMNFMKREGNTRIAKSEMKEKIQKSTNVESCSIIDSEVINSSMSDSNDCKYFGQKVFYRIDNENKYFSSHGGKRIFSDEVVCK